MNLSPVGGRSLKLTDYYRAEARCYLPDRAKTEAETMRQNRGRGIKVETEARQCEAEARPSQLKKTAPRPSRAEADASRTTSLHRTFSSRQMQAICMHDANQTSCKQAAATLCRAPLFSPRGRRADGNNVAAVSHGQHPLTSTVAAANTAMRKRGLCCQWLNENVESKKKFN